MKNAITAACVAALLAAAANAAPPARMKVREQALETNTLALSIPSSASGSLTVKKCADCPYLTLRLTEDSVYRVGRERVTLAQFAKHLQGATQRPINVFYDAEQRTVTRLTTTGPLAPAGRE